MIEKPFTPLQSARQEAARAPAPSETEQSTSGRTANPDQQISTLTNLLSNLDESPAVLESDKSHQDRLVRARLGVASSLFTALRSKHPPTAMHCLRVALGCSSWGLQLDVPDTYRDEIEIAALLHDIGKIGLPDSVLMNAGRLTEDEAQLMGRHRMVGLEILKGCAPSESLLKAVYYSGAWFDGSKQGYSVAGDEIPFASRMIAVVDAFDSMTIEHVYRKAMSRERAMAELFENAGTQFDPRLVKDFCTFVSEDLVRLESKVARRWLQDLNDRAADMVWQVGSARKSDFASEGADEGFASFHNRLLETMHDGVIYVDKNLRILHWNRGAERITGLKASTVCETKFDPTHLRMRDENGEFLTEDSCPVAATIVSGRQSYRRLAISGRSDKVQLNAYLSPVVARDGTVRGATMLLHDASSQVSLEESVQQLRERASRDQLTKVANRAEFDRVHTQLVQQHINLKAPLSLIICDIDHFKSINDTYGHQAGDNVLTDFAALLSSNCRSGDLVARYGGEEFCILCTDCDNARATQQADELRQLLETTPHQVLNGECITASFGVTELQGGDTVETMLRRADRALYHAKDQGRNLVVQPGSGILEEPASETNSWFDWLTKSAPEQVFERRLLTSVPLSISAEKLKGFIADHGAEIMLVDKNHATLRIDGQNASAMRRLSDRGVPFLVDLKFSEHRPDAQDQTGGNAARTVIDVVIQPTRRRDRRRSDTDQRARQILGSLKSYFMGHDIEIGE